MQENLDARDKQDSQRAAAPLMLGLGAKYINTSKLTIEQTSQIILDDVRARITDALNDTKPKPHESNEFAKAV